jgi:hypothetical protein
MKTLPRFLSSTTSGRRDLRTLLRPLPPTLGRLVGEEGADHEALATRFGEAVGRQLALRKRLEELEASDETKARAAVAAGKAVPKGQAPRIRDELEDLERELDAISELVGPSAATLLASAAPYARAAADRARAEADAHETRATELLLEAQRELELADALRSEAAWSTTLAEDGEAWAWTGHRTASGAADRAVVEALQVVERERERREEFILEREREAAAINTVRSGSGSGAVVKQLPPPPGSEAWSVDEPARSGVADDSANAGMAAVRCGSRLAVL